MGKNITIVNAINAFGENGIASHEIEVESDAEDENSNLNFEEKLRKLKSLKDGVLYVVI